MFIYRAIRTVHFQTAGLRLPCSICRFGPWAAGQSLVDSRCCLWSDASLLLVLIHVGGARRTRVVLIQTLSRPSRINYEDPSRGSCMHIKPMSAYIVTTPKLRPRRFIRMRNIMHCYQQGRLDAQSRDNRAPRPHRHERSHFVATWCSGPSNTPTIIAYGGSLEDEVIHHGMASVSDEHIPCQSQPTRSCKPACTCRPPLASHTMVQPLKWQRGTPPRQARIPGGEGGMKSYSIAQKTMCCSLLTADRTTMNSQPLETYATSQASHRAFSPSAGSFLSSTSPTR